MAYDARPGGGAMWRLMPDGTTTRLFGDLTISNGLAFSADGARAFYVDTPTGRVDVFDWSDADGLVGRRPFADLTGEDGHPDGLCLDSAGNVWVAMHSGSQVLGLDEHGKVAERISVGATQVTACAFGARAGAPWSSTPAGRTWPMVTIPRPVPCSRPGPACTVPSTSCSSGTDRGPRRACSLAGPCAGPRQAVGPAPAASALSAERSRATPVDSDSSMSS